MDDQVEEIKLAYKDDCMFYLDQDLVKFFGDYNIRINSLSEEDQDDDSVIYTRRILINQKNYRFTFDESLDDDYEPCHLSCWIDNESFNGGCEIMEKIIAITRLDIMEHEEKEIEKELKNIETSIERHLYEVTVMTYLSSSAFSFKLPLDIVMNLI